MKLYAITKGEYSDYHIVALTASLSKAKRLREIYSDVYHDAQIETFEDGEGAELNVLWLYYPILNEVEPDEYRGNETDGELRFNAAGEVCRVVVSAPDADHARKKAQDLIARYKARKAGL